MEKKITIKNKEYIKQDVSFLNSCPSIEFYFETIKHSESYRPDCLIMKVVGKYRIGSAGNPDAFYIKLKMDMAVDFWRPETLILDFTQLDYEWGDDMDYTLNGPENEIPFVVVVGEKCRNAISTLRYGIESIEDIVVNVDYFDNLEIAIENLLKNKSS